ncbi:MAG: MBL fold metallo-hydrolase [Leptolyngbyaceae cyanobacterium T60_A2020_046]|nr:MBL fold metallo-hydrolase [Leptolyngbyaceae cyanobacterium T60_A2020_046]
MQRPPRLVLDGIYAFSPNRATLGAIAYFIVEKDADGNPANLLIDTPPWNEEIAAFLASQGGVQGWTMTHRGGIGKVQPIQAALGCPIVMQEQEAYLLPSVENRVTYRDRFVFSAQTDVRWTPGHSPGSACVYHRAHGGVLFTGRHLLPQRGGAIAPLRFAKTFHWPRQLQQVEALRAEFSSATLAYLCPAANVGFLRGDRAVANAYEALNAIDLDALRHSTPLP